MTSTELEQLLNKVRWQQAEMSQEELAESLRAIGEYPNYLLVMVDGGLAYAPDDQDRALPAVFTNEESRRLFLEWLPKDLVQQQLYITLGGRQLFSQLSQEPIDGLVFNCLGPMQPLAFVPSFCQWVLEQLPPEPRPQVE